MVGLLSVRKMFEPRATCVLQADAREGATTIRYLSMASHRFICIMVVYCLNAYASETMTSSLHAPCVTLTARVS
jgi:hypothetical protein